MDLGGGEIRGAVQRQQVMAVQIDEAFKHLAALQATEDLAERGPQVRGIERIQDVPHLRVCSKSPMLWSVSVVACTETDPGTSPRSADGASTESC